MFNRIHLAALTFIFGHQEVGLIYDSCRASLKESYSIRVLCSRVCLESARMGHIRKALSAS